MMVSIRFMYTNSHICLYLDDVYTKMHVQYTPHNLNKTVSNASEIE